MACLPEVEGKGGEEPWASGGGRWFLDSMDEGECGEAHSLKCVFKGLHG